MPEWASFLEKIQQSASDGFPFDSNLYHTAQELLERCQDKPYPPQDFFKYLCGGYEAQWPLPDRFCLFGFVGALLIRSRHLMMSPDPEIQKAADMDFQYATTVLGKEGSVDFLDSSPWPVSILDLYLNVNQTEFVTWEHYKHMNPVPSPVISPESIHWRPPAQKRADVLRLPPSTTIAVLGTHATLSLEPVDMLRRFIHDVNLRPVFFGLEPRWCEILGMCDQGTAALSQLFKSAEKDPYAFPWAEMEARLDEIYAGDTNLRDASLLLCTEPLAGCLMLREVARKRGHNLSLLGYLGVALLNSCPPEDLGLFWKSFTKTMGENQNGQPSAIMAVNNLILSEQIFYQSGYRIPYVRAHGLYTGMAYTPLRPNQLLVWRAPLFMYNTVQCALFRFVQGMPEYPMDFKFVDEKESVPYQQAAQYKAVVLLPWDHALMTFYELYSAGVPLLLPAADWMYRFLYQRGQLSVGERMYQAVRPGHQPPHAEFAEEEVFKERAGPPDPHVGLSSAKAARGVAEDMLARGLDAPDVTTAKQYMKAALELVQDMRFFLTVAENRTGSEDSYSSMGVVRRTTRNKGKTQSQSEQSATVEESASNTAIEPAAADSGLEGQENSPASPWHPYTPFQMSTRDSNDWTRMRKGGWWLRRGARFDAMRYWYQFSDFARFPGLQYFANIPELLCMAQTIDVQSAAEEMRRYNEQTLVHSSAFWLHAFTELLGNAA